MLPRPPLRQQSPPDDCASAATTRVYRATASVPRCGPARCSPQRRFRVRASNPVARRHSIARATGLRSEHSAAPQRHLEGAAVITLTVVTAVMLGTSLAAACAMWRDKRAAERGARRWPESTLHLLELLGGWPGSLMAQRLFRHKTRKLSYQILFWLCVIANLAALGVVFWSASGLLHSRDSGSRHPRSTPAPDRLVASFEVRSQILARRQRSVETEASGRMPATPRAPFRGGAAPEIAGCAAAADRRSRTC